MNSLIYILFVIGAFSLLRVPDEFWKALKDTIKEIFDK